MVSGIQWNYLESKILHGKGTRMPVKRAIDYIFRKGIFKEQVVFSEAKIIYILQHQQVC